MKIDDCTIDTLVKYQDETGIITSLNEVNIFVKFGDDVASKACTADTLEPHVLPCPFCGIDQDTNHVDAFTTVVAGKWGSVRCLSCGAIGPEVRAQYRELHEWKQDAINEWNIRA